ncbi:MAG: hypothetical protein M3N28_05340 [Actinomycetota bacterium]|nr:hypothetical protein [Actinomycetota bacterium]
MTRRWPCSDLAYFCEDDYLFRPDAFARLAEASRDLPQADYFAFYATPDPAGPCLSTSSGAGWHEAEWVLPKPVASLPLKATTGRVGGRAALNLASYGYRRRPRLLVTDVPALATHMEEPHLAGGVDWQEIASDTARWAERRGIHLSPADAS